MTRIWPIVLSAGFFALGIGTPLLAAGAPAAKVKPEKLEAGSDYFAVRAWLIQQGWKPVISSYKFRNDPDRAFGEERTYWEHGAVEAERCYVDAPGGCVVRFKRGRDCLRIQTTGELIPDMAVPAVDRWDHECASGAHSRDGSKAKP